MEGVNNELRVEFYPIHLLVYRVMRYPINSPLSKPTAHVLSRVTPLRELISTIIRPKLVQWGHSNTSWRIWKVDAEAIHGDNMGVGYSPERLMLVDPTPTLLPVSSGGGDMHISLEDAMIRDDDRLVIDLNMGNGWIVNDDTLAEVGLAEPKGSPLFADGDFFKEMEEAERPSSGKSGAVGTRMIGPMLPGQSSGNNYASGSSSGGYGYGSGYGSYGGYGYGGGYGYSMMRSQGPPRKRGTIGLINL